jgi:hypothetical protein
MILPVESRIGDSLIDNRRLGLISLDPTRVEASLEG